MGEVTREEGIFIYTSDKMQRIKEIIDQIANTDVTVLTQGESGVGKEVVAPFHPSQFLSQRETVCQGELCCPPSGTFGE